jgi:hypothetical protein
LTLTNIGVFLFDKQELCAKAPEFIWINELEVTQSKAKIENSAYILEFYRNGQLAWQVSCPNIQTWKEWDIKAKEMLAIYLQHRG